MRRDILELADDSLFIETSNHVFSAAEAHLPTGRSGFSKEGAFGFDSTSLQTASLLLGRDTDAIITAAAALLPLRWKDHANSGAVRKHLDRNVTAVFEDQRFPLIVRIDNFNFIYAT
jgi:hypothetical protein